MASTYTVNFSIELPAHNDYVNDWELPVNTNLTLIDSIFGAFTVLNPTGLSGVVSLTTTNNPSPPPTSKTAPWQVPNIIVGASFSSPATLTANVNYQLPSGVGGRWTVLNNTTGSFTITFSSAGGGNSVVIPQGKRVGIVSDGTNVTPDANASAATAFSVNQLDLLGSSAGFVALKAPASSGSQVFTLPSADGSAGQVLSTNGSGVLGWVAAGSGTFSAGTTGFTPTTATSNATLGGVLNVANGGTGNSTIFSSGAVIWVGGGGVYTADQANLAWDDINHRLGIGTNGPAFPLDIVTNSNSFTSIGRVYNLSAGSSAGAEFLVQCGSIQASLQTTPANTGVGSLTATTFNIYSNSLNAISISPSQVVTLTNPLPVGSGGTGVTTSTGSGSNVLSVSPALTGSPTVNGNAIAAATTSAEFNNGVAGETLTISTWSIRTLGSTVLNNISGASLASNRVTLPAGTYFFSATAGVTTTGSAGFHQIRLYNFTDSAVINTGVQGYLAVNTSSFAAMQGTFTISGSKAVEVDSFMNPGGTGQGVDITFLKIG